MLERARFISTLCFLERHDGGTNDRGTDNGMRQKAPDRSAKSGRLAEHFTG